MISEKDAFAIPPQELDRRNFVRSAIIILFFAFVTKICSAQDSVAYLSTGMFDGQQQIFLSDLHAWLFKTGHDPTWATNELDVASWEKLRPTDLSIKNADTNGKLEGWFRIKIVLDSTFKDVAIGLRRGTWAATDIYVNENLFSSFGVTGDGNHAYQEYNPIDKFSLPLNLEVGREYLIAIHFVDYTTPSYPIRLKSEATGGTFTETSGGLRTLVMLTGTAFNSFLLKASRERLHYRTIWVSVTSLLSLLFWLLAFQNPNERKTLSLIAIFSTLTALHNLLRFFFTDPDVSFVTFRISDLLSRIGQLGILTMLIVVVANILKSQIPRIFWVGLISLSIFCVISVDVYFYPIFYALTLFSFCIFVFILVVSWQKIKGAQWAIVVGLSLTTLFGLLIGVMFSYLVTTCFYFSLPLSLLVYVSWRFREIIGEVREKAVQLIQITEEKKQQALNQQKILEEEVARQTSELRTTLDNLKSTQAQLIQSEKMASLGELTAGIAHEIQNPLNFVNNFSEVSNELLNEMGEEIEKGNLVTAKTLNADVRSNLEKIIHHGKRADGIVKGMLQHSRTSSGAKEPTDINALTDEYLRLAFHGFRAKDKSFNVTTKTDFDEKVGKVNVVPQDIGRVILNLITNAFYAVTEKKRQSSEDYEPVVTLRTKKQGDLVLIYVIDNGNGIPHNLLDKIFQPFFTTKPSGQGTGLGLSLSYDILKAHGGTIKINTTENEGAEFIVELPFR